MIAVTGVTGNLGRVVIEDLLTKLPGDELVAVVRDVSKAAPYRDNRNVDVRHGDYDDPASLATAFAGVDTLLFVSSPDVTPGVRPRQHAAVIDAAKAAGVSRIVYTSAIEADKHATGFLADHGITERLIRESGVPFTFLRNTFYAEALVNPGLNGAVAAGELAAADQGKPVNWATIEDMGLAASAVLTGDGHEGGVYEIRGPLWSVEELAATVAEVAGKPVAYRAVASSELPGIGFVYDLIAGGLFSEPGDDLEKLLGRPVTPLREAVAKVLG